MFLFPVKKPESGEKYPQIKHSLQAKAVLNSFQQYVGGLWQQEMDFFTGGSIIMDYGSQFLPKVMV